MPAEAQKITQNGTTVIASLSSSYDLDYFEIYAADDCTHMSSRQGKNAIS